MRKAPALCAGDQEGFSTEPRPHSQREQVGAVDAATQEPDLVDEPLPTHRTDAKAVEKGGAWAAHLVQVLRI